MKIHLAEHRGYCSGVSRAIKILNGALQTYETVYVNHEIIHNKFIIDYYKNKGVIFEENINNIPGESNLVISAHGTDPGYIKKLQDKNINNVDATCPLVLKVHREATMFLKGGYKIIYIGKKGHQEAKGVIGNGEENIFLVSNKNDIDNLVHLSPFFASIFGKNEGKLAVLTQTTLSVTDTKNLIEYIRDLYPSLEVPKTTDICYATTDRQNAMSDLAKKCDLIYVVGSVTSSNSNKLKDLAESLGVKAYLIDSYSEIRISDLLGKSNIGVSAGASAPEHLIQEVVDFIKKNT